MAAVLTNAGKAITTSRLKGTGTEPNYVAWGTGTGTAAVADTTLFTEASEARVAGTSIQQTTAVANDTYLVVGTIIADGAKTITNIGLFDAASAGNLFMHADFGGSGVPLNAGDAIQLVQKVQYT